MSEETDFEAFNRLVYMESADDGGGILLACDVCRDQGRDRIVKQLGWMVTLQHARQMQVEHIKEHPITDFHNEVR